MKQFIVSYLFFVVFILSDWGQVRGNLNGRKKGPNGVVDVKVYYESLCRACRYEIINDVSKLVKTLGPRVHLELVPYGKCKTTLAANGTLVFSAQHGPDEVYGNKLHACALHLLDPISSILYNGCLMIGSNSDSGSNDRAVDQCSPQYGVNGEAIKQCARSEMGSLLLKAAGEKTPPTSEVPYCLINGAPGQGHLFEEVYKIATQTPRN